MTTMTEELWATVDRYLADTIVKPDAALNAALSSSDAAGLPSINVSPSQGKFLQMLARLVNARTILEVGTLGGYSTIWLARALKPGGRLVTLEADARHAELARANIARAGLGKPWMPGMEAARGDNASRAWQGVLSRRREGNLALPNHRIPRDR